MQELLTVQEVAGVLKITAFTVRKYLKSGALRGVKVGKYWRVRECDLEAYVRNLPTRESESE
jgi:excisionase family DNA binding protein